VLAAIDLELHLIDVPFLTWTGTASAHSVGEGLPELAAPSPDCLVAHGDATLRQQFLHVPVAQEEPIVQPDGMADELAGEPVTLIQGGGLLHRRVLRHRPVASPPTYRDNASLQALERVIAGRQRRA